jgi:Rieske Fe-S protein
MNMDKKLTTSRRDFLRNTLTLAVVSAAIPGAVFGRIMPEFRKGSSGQLVATYTIKLSDYPNLGTVGGSIKLTSNEQLKLNPDHLEHFDLILKGQNSKRGWYPIAITRVAESGANAFKAVSTYCQHGEGYQVDYVPSGTAGAVGRFVCPHQKSTFEADGSHVTLKNTPDVGDLRKFQVTFDGETITLTLDDVSSVVGDMDELPSKPFLDQNYPNPFNPTTMIRYGLPGDMQARMTVYTLLGKPIKVLFDERQESGVHFYDFSAADLPSGVYFYRLETPGGTLTRRMTISK